MIILGLFLALFQVALCENPMICLDQGACFKGSWMQTETGNRFAAFYGIKYAEDPVKNLRFKAPKPFQAPQGLWDVSQDPQISCVQIDKIVQETPFGQEDCLVLNVYVPESAILNQDSLPVMAWIHGGALKLGAGYYQQYGPQIFMDKKIILVSINYRLGIFGFLSLGDEIVPGNAGFRDQNLALKWVHENIENFFGDPEKVTIFGQSAGGESVSYHLISPKSRGLFRRAIMQINVLLGQNQRFT